MTVLDLKKYKTSDRIYILGSGRSVLDITEEEWQEIKNHDSIGFNHWYVHDHIPTFYDLSYLANDYFSSKEEDMFYLASKNCSKSHFILNEGLDQQHKDLFSDLSYGTVLINHFDFFEKDYIDILNAKDREIGKYGKYWTTEFFSVFNRPLGEILPNQDFIFKSRGQLFATIQIATLLGYTDIRLIGVDLNDEGKFQDFYTTAPASAKSVGHGGETFKPRFNVTKNVKNPNGVHNTCQGTKDVDYLGIHKLLYLYSEKCLKRLGASLTVTNEHSLLTSVGIKYNPIRSKLHMEKITFCIPSKSNTRYLKTCISSIRQNAYRKDHEIIIFVDSDEDGTVKWLEEVKDQYNLTYFINPNIGESLYGIGKAYDYCIEEATSDIFMVFHADMILGKYADFNAYRYLKSKTVVCSTRIEPPLHPNGGEKILIDYGIWPEDFKNKEFANYVETQLNNPKTTEGVFAPWMMYRSEFLGLGGHDPRMHSCREDSDIFNRMYLAGFNFIQPWSSLVYHFTGRGAGSFDGDKERHEKWKEDMNNSTKEFIRKWGSNVKHTALLTPIIPPKYDIGIRVLNCNSEFLEVLEPWCNNILIDDEMQILTSQYIEKEQKKTLSELKDKIKSTPFQNLDNEIVIEVDRNTFDNSDFQLLQQLPEIIKDSGEVGKFQLGNLFITINAMNEYQNQLIKV